MAELELLREIWIDVLAESDIADDDNFFMIGGDSMLALEVANRAQDAGLDLPYSAVLRTPVLRDLAAVAELPSPSERSGRDSTPGDSA